MTTKYKVFISSIVAYIIILFLASGGSGSSLGIPKFLDHAGVLQAISTVCTNSISGSCTTNMVPASTVWPHLSMLISLFGVSYLADKISRGTLSVGHLITILLILVSVWVLAIFSGGRGLNFVIMNVLDFSGYSHNLLIHYRAYLFFLLLGLIGLSEAIYNKWFTSPSAAEGEV